jgi:predicted DNA-binding transcriptional regulator YafY
VGQIPLLRGNLTVYRRGDFGQVSRALRVVDELRGFKHGRWVNDVADALGTSERTVRRDILELQDAGIDIEITKRANRMVAILTAERSHAPVSITEAPPPKGGGFAGD